MKILLKKKKIKKFFQKNRKYKKYNKHLNYNNLLEKIIINDILYDLEDLKGKKLNYNEKLAIFILFKNKIQFNKEFMYFLNLKDLKKLKIILKKYNFKDKKSIIFANIILKLIKEVGTNNFKKVIVENFENNY